MQLSSFLYLIFFFLVAVVNYLIPNRFRWVWLLVASYLFCVYADYRFALAVLLVTGLAYGGGRLIDRAEERPAKRTWLIVSLVLCLIPLFTTKYLNFSLNILEDVLKVAGISRDFTALDILIPMGISFYTFQVISYLFDIYNGVVPAEKNVGQFALYLAFFPKLVSGPIERAGALLPQLRQPKAFEYQRLLDGLVRIGWGFFKKLVVADRLGVLVNSVFYAPGEFGGPVVLLAVFGYSLQIYIDFSAYCDIAIGSARILGIDLVENFNAPYFARSVTEFWRRWHISLTDWLRDYIYTPLNFAMRRKRSRFLQYLNIVITFLVSGIWHGANYTFVIWGLLHGLYQAVEAATLKWRDRFVKRYGIDRESFGHRFFQMAGTFLLVSFAWIFFRSENIHVAGAVIKAIFTMRNITQATGWDLTRLGLSQPNLLILVFALIVVMAFEVLGQRGDLIKALNRQPLAFRWLVYLSLIFAVVIYGYFGIFTAENFIYAGF